MKVMKMSDRETVTVEFKLQIGLVGCEKTVTKEIPKEEIPERAYYDDYLYLKAERIFQDEVQYTFEIKDEEYNDN